MSQPVVGGHLAALVNEGLVERTRRKGSGPICSDALSVRPLVDMCRRSTGNHPAASKDPVAVR